MSDEASPRPWRVVDYAQCPGLADIFDASGSPSGLVAGELKPADAALIVDAVNFYDATVDTQLMALLAERDRLRDIVRRLADLSESLLANYEYRYREDANSMAFVENTRGFLREARAAIGEEKP
jgi:hypothetical protein